MSIRMRVVLLLVLEVAVPCLQARTMTPRRRAHGGAIALRRRVHVNSLITDPGTAELEWNFTAAQTSAFGMPMLLKWTPEGPRLLWGRTEFSAGFDAFASTLHSERRVTQTSDHLSLAATMLLLNSERWSLAASPVLTAALRADGQSRAGVSAIGRYDHGRNSIGGAITWTSRIGASEDAPAGVWDFTAGYGRNLSKRLIAHVNWQCDRLTGGGTEWSAIEGAQVQLAGSIAIDLSAQQLRTTSNGFDHQVIVGLTIGLGRPREWFSPRGNR